MEHPWLADVEWERMAHKKLKPPFKPIVSLTPFRASNKITSHTKNKFQRIPLWKMKKRLCSCSETSTHKAFSTDIILRENMKEMKE